MFTSCVVVLIELSTVTRLPKSGPNEAAGTIVGTTWGNMAPKTQVIQSDEIYWLGFLFIPSGSGRNYTVPIGSNVSALTWRSQMN